MNHLTLFSRTFLLGIALCATTSKAAILPYGVQNDIALTTVTSDWGWEEIYRGDYSLDNVPLQTVFDGHKGYIMLAAQQRGSAELELLSAVKWEDFIVYTPQNETKTLNGAEWYYNGGGLGFADLGQLISQSNCDILLDTPTRLCWHTHVSPGVIDYDLLPNLLDHGYRAGNVFDLNFGDTGWDRVVFTADITPVPILPASLLYLSSFLMLNLKKLRDF